MKRKYFLIVPTALICCLSFTACEKSIETPVAPKKETVTRKELETNLNNSVILELVINLRIQGCECTEADGTITKMPPVGVLTWSSQLAQIAKDHSNDMEAKGYFEHINLAGKTPCDRMTAGGYIWTVATENIARGQLTEKEVFTSWLNSKKGHCNAMMDPNVKEMGVARSNGTAYYWTQLFGAKKIVNRSVGSYQFPI